MSKLLYILLCIFLIQTVSADVVMSGGGFAGVIIGTAVGGIVIGVIICAIGMWCCYCRDTRSLWV